MTKRIFCILLVISLVVTSVTSCKKKQEEEIKPQGITEESDNFTDVPSGGDIQTEEDGANSEEGKNNNSNQIPSSDNSNKPINTTTNNKLSSQSNNTANNGSNQTPTSVNTNNSNANSTNTNTQSSSISKEEPKKEDTKPVDNLVIKTNDSLYETYPALTEEYLYPSEAITNFKKNDTNIYENKYVKLDATTAKDGYLLLTYKEPWADKIWVILDETAVHSGYFEKTHHYYYNNGDFKLGEPIAIGLPKTDAIYYLAIDSEINGINSDKLVVDLGQITVAGAVSYQDMVPTEEQIKLTNLGGVYSNKYVKINTNTASQGYVDIQYVEPNGYNIEVSITANVKNQRGNCSSWHYYTKYRGNCNIKAALTYGSAEYTITVVSTMKNESTGVGRASKKAMLTVNLSNVCNTAPFLLSTGEVIYDSSMPFIQKANEIAATCKDDFEKVSKIYDWVTSYINYGGNEYKALGLYKCNLNEIYNSKQGVCYDYAVVLAAMLRSQGIPCKVVFGKYANSTGASGHAWNEVYIASGGSITSDKLSVTGNKWCRLDPTMSNVSTGQIAIDYMNNASNYTWYSYY